MSEIDGPIIRHICGPVHLNMCYWWETEPCACERVREAYFTAVWIGENDRLLSKGDNCSLAVLLSEDKTAIRMGYILTVNVVRTFGDSLGPIMGQKYVGGDEGYMKRKKKTTTTNKISFTVTEPTISRHCGMHTFLEMPHHQLGVPFNWM